jgi:hypothetical protein
MQVTKSKFMDQRTVSVGLAPVRKTRLPVRNVTSKYDEGRELEALRVRTTTEVHVSHRHRHRASTADSRETTQAASRDFHLSAVPHFAQKKL